MSQMASQWDMLKGALRTAIERREGYRVTHALFTTYAFEPEFFETSILPLLLPDGGEGLSLHLAVRRLQMEALLRESLISIDVYFDSRVVVPGCPLLPYAMVPVRMKDEFHGKIILLRLQDEGDNVCWILGAGSANLTKAGWWENIESWFFTPDFDPARPPAGVLPGLSALFEFLAERTRPDSVTRFLNEELDDTRSPRLRAGEPVFGVFAPGVESFVKWLGERAKGSGKGTLLEVISPYFADREHAALVRKLLNATGCQALNVWLPEDPWQAGGPAALIAKSCYDALEEVAELSWCGFLDTDLAGSRKKEETPRFLHAKVIRSPGRFCFMGSVNFSNKAFESNFEAGFFFPDKGSVWLTALTRKPSRFLKPVEQACHEGVDDSGPELCADFNWQTLELRLDFVRDKDRRKHLGTVVQLIDAQGRNTERRVRLKGAVKLTVDEPLYRDLQSNPWIKVAFEDKSIAKSIAVVWVQQHALDYRPPPVDLRPDVWRILEMWRSLAEGSKGSHPGDFEQLEVLLKRRGDGGEAPPEGAPEQDIFEEMAGVHGSFYLLRTRLQKERDDGKSARCEYYFSAPRPDSLMSLVDRIELPIEGESIEPVAAWVMLQWMTQICNDHQGMPSAMVLRSRTLQLLDDLLAQEPLSSLDPIWLEWAEWMFLCAPGQERGVVQHFRKQKAQR
jgi:hypothetical protein